MAKQKKEKKIKERSLAGTLGLAVLTLAFPPAGAFVIVNDFTKGTKVKKADDQRHAEIDTLISLEHDKATAVKESTPETTEETKEENTKEEGS